MEKSTIKGAVRLGYLNVALDEGKRLRKNIIIDPERGHLIQKMFELYATDQYSLETIRRKMIELGLVTLKGNKPSKSGIENLLKDSFYCGIAMSPKYGSYAHIYPRLISREVFDICQKIRTKRTTYTYKALSKDFIFKGLLKCDNCNCTMTPEVKKKPSGKEYIFYSCTNSRGICERVYVNEKELLEPIYEVLEQFESIFEQTQNDLVNELRSNTEAEVTYHKSEITRIRAEIDALDRKKEKLLEAFLDETIAKSIFDKKNKEYMDQMEVLEIELREHSTGNNDYQTTVATVISVARRAKSIFENSSDIAGKRAFLSTLLQNPTVNKKKLCFTIASPYNLVLELASHPNWLAWQSDFRTFNWSKAVGDPELTVREVNYLLSLV